MVKRRKRKKKGGNSYLPRFAMALTCMSLKSGDGGEVDLFPYPEQWSRPLQWVAMALPLVLCLGSSRRSALKTIGTGPIDVERSTAVCG